jgi:hypothetical protein
MASAGAGDQQVGRDGGRDCEARDHAAGTCVGPRRARGPLLRCHGGRRVLATMLLLRSVNGPAHCQRAGVCGSQPREARWERRQAVPPQGEVLATESGVRGRHAQGHRGPAAGPLL